MRQLIVLPFLGLLILVAGGLLAGCGQATPAGPVNIQGNNNTVCPGGSGDGGNSCTGIPPVTPIVPVVVTNPPVALSAVGK